MAKFVIRGKEEEPEEVVEFDADHIVLNTGGWFTATTKARMNQTSNQFGLGYYVYSEDGNFGVSWTCPETGCEMEQEFGRYGIRIDRRTGNAESF